MCSEPAVPWSVSAEVNPCLDRLVDADAQDIPGVHLDWNVTPQNDPEILPALNQYQFASRAPSASATSWGPHAIAVQQLETPPALSQSASSFPGQLPAVTTLPPMEVADSTPPNLSAASTLDRKLARARIRKQQEASLRQSRALQESFDQLCQQMRLSNLECRLKLRNQKPPVPSFSEQTTKSYPQTKH